MAICRDFRPDHNGECLNCDEWADAHAYRPATRLEWVLAYAFWIGCLPLLWVKIIGHWWSCRPTAINQVMHEVKQFMEDRE